MKLSDFNQISTDPSQIKDKTLAWDLVFVCLIFLIASTSFFYDSYQENNPDMVLKSSQINLK